ncbi:histidine kinase [Kribbella solani]|uniref:sensor histidine kinase n=1 Tax=Kribbella solani TaxID=236067 RepID=UPI0029A9E243|nr:histidine kinase [Kribbella solani]MDX3005548.1 histidine kinase [Kribbella solani]
MGDADVRLMADPRLWLRGRFGLVALGIAVICAGTDAAVMLLFGPPMNNWRPITLLIAAIVVDLALAAPPRWVAWVAGAHAAVFILSPLLMPGRPATEPEVNNFGALIAAFLAGAWLRNRPAGLVLAGLIAAGVIGHGIERDPQSGWDLIILTSSASILLPGLVGRLTITHRTYLADLERRTERLTREREIAIREAVADDRGALARDLHDGLSHHMSAISIHAGAARLALADSPPGGAQQALTSVESASRSAMLDLRRLLDLLHGQPEESDRQAGLGSVEELLVGVRAAGLPVTLTVTGAERELPASLDVALYRIVQEALTNALRHGNGDNARVSIVYEPDAILVAVTNGLGERPAVGWQTSMGRGLAGICSRVRLFGGEVGCGPEGATWQLRVRVPLDAE